MVLFLMSLTNDFEHVHASLLHRSPLPTLDQAITELLSEETHLAPRKPTPINVAFTTVKGSPSNNKHQSYGSSKKICNYCKKPGHILLECPIRVCQFCLKEAPGHLQRDCFKIPTDIPNNTHHTVLLLESLPLQLKVRHPLLPLKSSLLLR